MDLDKPLSKWTLKDFSEFCKDRDCTDCELRENICDRPPDKWDMADKGSDITDVVPDPPTAENTNVPDNPAKPRLAEVLGLEVGERVRLPKFSDTVDCWVAADGWMHSKNGLVMLEYVFDAINRPESIFRVPRLTEAELERCRVMGAKYLTRNGDKESVHMWGTRPEKCTYSGAAYYIIGYSKARHLGVVDRELFPSVQPEDCICVEEVNHEK